MKLGIDLDDVIAVCAVPYLRKFAQEFGVELPDEREIGWHLLASLDDRVSPADRDRFRIKLYDGTFFSTSTPSARRSSSGWSRPATTCSSSRRARSAGG